MNDATAEYVHGQLRDSHAALLAAFTAESDASIVACRPRLDIAYGTHAREKFDLYVSARPWRATLAYFHAGYWQSRDKAQFRFLAPLMMAHGIDVAMVNYPLCPEVGVRDIVAAARKSVGAILDRPGRGDGRLVACGHSAGAHLAVELALALPERIAGVVAVSGVFDLEPLLTTPLNEKLRLDGAEARAMSPLYRVGGSLPPALFVVGATETAAFVEQTRAMQQAWSDDATLHEVPNADHFSVLRSLPALVLDFLKS